MSFWDVSFDVFEWGTEEKKAFNTASIEPKVVFTPSVEFKERLRHIKYTQETE